MTLGHSRQLRRLGKLHLADSAELLFGPKVWVDQSSLSDFVLFENLFMIKKGILIITVYKTIKTFLMVLGSFEKACQP